jgi:hypothetical protein
MKILITDHDFPDVALEQALYQAAGVEVVTAQCRSEEDVIAAADGCDGLLVQYAPVGGKVFAACPRVRIVSRYGAGAGRLAQGGPIVAAQSRRVVIDLEEVVTDAGVQRRVHRSARKSEPDRRKQMDLPLDRAHGVHSRVMFDHPAEKHIAGPSPKLAVDTEVRLPPDGNVIGIEVIFVVIQVHVERGVAMFTRLGHVVDLGVATDAPRAGVDVADNHVVNGERVFPLSGLSDTGHER